MMNSLVAWPEAPEVVASTKFAGTRRLLISKPVSSKTSRMAQSAGSSSLPILPLGKPHEELLDHPLTNKH